MLIYRTSLNGLGYDVNDKEPYIRLRQGARGL